MFVRLDVGHTAASQIFDLSLERGLSVRTVFPYHIEEAAFFVGSPPGYLVEVGANEPQCGSQTWQFEQAGRSGV